MGNSHSRNSHGGSPNSATQAQGSSQNLCRIDRDLHGCDKCLACRNLEALVAFWMAPNTAANRSPHASSAPQLFHNSYAELDECARRCISCRVMRRALVLQQPTIDDISTLTFLRQPAQSKDYDHHHQQQQQLQVYAVLTGGNQNLDHGPVLTVALVDPVSGPLSDRRTRAHIQLSLQGQHQQAQKIQQMSGYQQWSYMHMPAAYTPRIEPESRRLALTADTGTTYQQVYSWASTCHAQHVECKNLAWSSQVPSRLLRISPDGSAVQLVSSTSLQADHTRYTALSYCWGLSRTANTVTSNVRQRETRPFPTEDLPRTIRDAIIFSVRSGVDYIWIDSLCIIQDSPSDWASEAARMHEVYSNAYFTLCAVAVDNADSGLFGTREAWRYPTEPSYLHNWRLTVAAEPFHDVKDLAFWSTRGWTMQEELLSPRTVYCGPNGVHWSCCLSQHAEAADNSVRNSGFSMSAATQSFLQALRSGQNLDQRWLDVIESYSVRNLTKKDDRFLALSGVAARYQARKPQDVYLAGLWLDSISLGLSWQIHTAVQRGPDRKKMYKCPSWSWASLPVPTPVSMGGRDRDTQYTGRIEVVRVDNGLPYSNENGDAVARVGKGSQVNSLTVRGRIKPLCSPFSRAVPWSSIMAGSTFSFHQYLDQEVHSINHDTGQFVTCPPRTKELVAQLDYLDTADQIMVDPAAITCLQISDGAMLLLRSVASTLSSRRGGSLEFTRVGISVDFRHDFFFGAEAAELVLV